MTSSLDPDQHRHLRESLGAWVLGALDGSARREVEAHVAACADCAVDVAAMSPLPGLLNRMSVDEVEEGRLAPDPGFAARLGDDLRRAESTVHRRLARWRAAAVAAMAVAAAAALAAGLAIVPDQAVPDVDRLVAAAQPVAAAAADTTGEVAALDWEWGTTVELQLADLPLREAYVVWVVADDGRREQAGTWGTTTTRGARVYGASAIPRDEVARIEVTAADGEGLLVFAFPSG